MGGASPWHRWRPSGRRQAEQDKKREPARRNVTDPGSRLMPVRGGGFIQAEMRDDERY